MERILDSQRIAAELAKRGMLPDRCRLVELRMGVKGAPVLAFEKFLSVDEWVKVADAIKAAADVEPKA